jgi:Flp pilus assembly protein TadB
VNPTYFGLLFNTTPGLVMVTVGVCLIILGVIWMQKVVKIDV